jgi:hypothetical protein
MVNIKHATQTGLKRILARFGRTAELKNPWRGDSWRKAKWHDCDVSSRGL